jgi:GNAT superfamily N-acetyltransferase
MGSVSAADVPRLDLDDRALGLAVEENLYDLFRAMAALLPQAELVERDGLSTHHSFPQNPMFKGIWGIRLPPEDVAAAVGDALAWQRERGAPFSFVWSGPATEPRSLGPALDELGLEPWEQDAPCQVAEIGALDWEALDGVPAGFSIERVRDDEGVTTFGATFIEAFELPEWAGQAWVDATRAVGIEKAPWRQYVGRLDGRPVATNMLFCGAGVAAVFGVGTVPDARGRGLGAAITLEPLREARERGYRYAVLFASDLGAPVYRRIGFRDVGVGISRWLWRAA